MVNFEEIVERAKILIVDDEQTAVRVMERMLSQVGYRQVASTTDPRRAVELFREIRPDLVILDLRMPDLDGFQVMERIQEHVAPGEYVPILVLTADVTNEKRLQALLLGAKDFLTKPVDRVEAMLRVRILLETRFLFRELAAGRTPAGARD